MTFPRVLSLLEVERCFGNGRDKGELQAHCGYSISAHVMHSLPSKAGVGLGWGGGWRPGCCSGVPAGEVVSRSLVLPLSRVF